MRNPRTALEAIERSVYRDEIVTVYWTEEIETDLRTGCDDSAENGDVMEFWGVDDAGNDWRVHLCFRGPGEQES